MIGEKDGKMVQIGPMFPRLHVNDHVEQGGRSTPPRNKMAICARVNSATSGSMMIPSTPLSHGNCQKMNGLSLFCNSPEASGYKAMNTRLPLSLFNPHYSTYHSANPPNKLYLPEKASIAHRVHTVTVEKEHSRNQEHRLVKGTSTEIISRDHQLSQKNPKSLHFEDVVDVSVISDSSEVDSTPRPDTTPDDVVRVIGLNSFWKIRQTIECQQRILSAQIFELHRLVKVQRLMARSPEMVLQRKVFQENKLQRKVFPENKKRNLSSISPNIIYRPFSPGPRAPGYQWLVPMRSRTEGLIYKPYMGPGFISPARSQTYLNAHSAMASTSKQEPSTDLSIIPSNIRQGKGKTIDALPLFPTKPMDKDQDQSRQQKTEVIKPESVNLGREETIAALPLFPTRPMDRDQNRQQKTEVIKVVPHNLSSTSESASRIFRSIQEERKPNN